ncbi:MAG: molybdopterin converting factor subunit 1 [Gammaproteobacteria bacterium]|nr:molybdopterin converting factor subunit 1 [Pseudomonadales bacterium]MCP5346182.1 molybdopterin converting factor subunit 1 [Pseudomonadales bacterium]
MLSLHFFASIREAAGRSSETLKLPDSVADVQGLIEFLVAREPERLAVLSGDNRVLVAVNQTVVDRSHSLQGDEEVAFFPPMTGG